MSPSVAKCGTVAELEGMTAAGDAPSVDEVACYLAGWEDAMARAKAIYLHDASLSHPDLAMHVLFNTSLSEEEAVALLDRLTAKGQAGQAPARRAGAVGGDLTI